MMQMEVVQLWHSYAVKGSSFLRIARYYSNIKKRQIRDPASTTDHEAIDICDLGFLVIGNRKLADGTERISLSIIKLSSLDRN
mmetsp:Transcript_102881/g.220014  ORF Transcript_102881/g.220014 Transcript_102881/m.220014 type:complete len:83 (+) Transcript_102881:1118-1366(+)